LTAIDSLLGELEPQAFTAFIVMTAVEDVAEVKLATPVVVEPEMVAPPLIAHA